MVERQAPACGVRSLEAASRIPKTHCRGRTRDYRIGRRCRYLYTQKPFATFAETRHKSAQRLVISKDERRDIVEMSVGSGQFSLRAFLLTVAVIGCFIGLYVHVWRFN